MPQLKMLRGPEPGNVYDLSGDTILIGRGRKNDIIIHDNEVSREHCRLVQVLDDYEIHDGVSTNGTFVDGHKVDSSGWMLYNNCIIEIGDSITFQYTQDASPFDTGQMDEGVSLAYNAKPFLVVKRASQDDITVYPLEGAIIELGRDLTNDIIMQEAEVSRHHVRFVRTPSGYTVEDMGSMNGTAVNGIFVKEPSLLRSDDMVTIGTTVEMLFVDENSNDYSYYRDTYLPHLEEDNATTHSRRPMRLDDLIGERNKRTTSEVQHGLIPHQLENHVFLVYAREDWETLVSHLYIYLEDNEVDVWADQYLPLESDDWKDAIDQAMVECSILIVAISPTSMKSDHVKRSLRHFVNREKPIILLEYQKVGRLPISVQNLGRIKYSASNPDEAFQRTLLEIQRMSS
jgi:pSer/pThr/pTyr-binding forkhead associated (FHA) protein